MDLQSSIPGLGGPWRWVVAPAAWRTDGGSLVVDALPRSDVFADPGGGGTVLGAARLLRPVSGDFRLRARVRGEFRSTYDAGVLLAWAGDASWAKLCLERSPQGVAMVVSVVTRGVSDDANAFAVDGDTAWLRIARTGDAFAFHASTDGAWWQLIRYFTIDGATTAEVGLEAQSPTGDGCRVTFSDVSLERGGIANLRDGS